MRSLFLETRRGSQFHEPKPPKRPEIGPGAAASALPRGRLSLGASPRPPRRRAPSRPVASPLQSYRRLAATSEPRCKPPRCRLPRCVCDQPHSHCTLGRRIDHTQAHRSPPYCDAHNYGARQPRPSSHRHTAIAAGASVIVQMHLRLGVLLVILPLSSCWYWEDYPGSPRTQTPEPSFRELPQGILSQVRLLSWWRLSSQHRWARPITCSL